MPFIKKNHGRPQYICPMMAVLLVFVFALSGCGRFVRTPYQRPRVDVPGQWAARSVHSNSKQCLDRWWQVFGDSNLDRLIDKVLETNNDLAVATIKLRRARLQAGLEATNRTPDVSAGLNARYSKGLKNGEFSKSAGTTTSLSWELDLWGRLAASRDAAQWEARATEQDRANTALSLVGTTADLYWQMAYLNQAIQTSRESIDYTRKTLGIVRVKYDVGDVSELDVLKAEQAVESQKSDLADLEQQIAEARNALAILFDQAPGPAMADPKRLVDMPLPVLDPGIPAAVLANRPDLKAAELRLRSTLADADVTRASYYPELSLTSEVGTSSERLLNLLENPVAVLGAGLTLPFVQWNRMQLKNRIAETEYAQAVVEFRQTLYKAFQDVENALSACRNYRVQETALRRALVLSEKAEQMAKVRYQAGKTGIQDWLDQQENRRNADLALARNRYNQLSNLMTLYLALGGGAGAGSANTTVTSTPISPH